MITCILIIVVLLPTIYESTKIIYQKGNKKIKEDTTINKQLPEEENKIDKLLKEMTLEEKIGQMMIIDYRKPAINEELTNILKTVKPGGFIFFTENFTSYKQSQELINNITKYADIPLFLTTDQEGGRINRFKNIKDIKLPVIPSMYEVGLKNDVNYTYQTGTQIANELKLFGLNMDMAPVADIYSNPNNTVIGDRSFGKTSEIVSLMSTTLAKSLRDASMIPVYKHFPGHGDTSTDSHQDLPIITKTKQELLELELVPFKEAIKNNAEVIMVGHLALPNITGNNIPASLSKTIVTDLLKNELNYQNLVITDALNMKAITNNYTDKEIYERAINAGVDILLMPNNPIESINEIKELIKEGKIKEEQINTSVKKILELKEKYNILKMG